MKKQLILLTSFVVLLFGYGVWKGYETYVFATELFVIKIKQTVNDIEVVSLTFGKIAKREGWDHSSKLIADSAMNSCASCVLLARELITDLPSQYDGIFENKPVGDIYLSVDTPDPEIADTRMFFLFDDFEIFYEDCLAEAKIMAEKMKMYDAKATCVDTLDSESVMKNK